MVTAPVWKTGGRGYATGVRIILPLPIYTRSRTHAFRGG